MKCNLIVFQIYPTAEIHATELLSWGNQVNIATSSVSNPCLFSRTCLVTRYYTGPNEFGPVFERLEELEMQYSQPERETISHNRLLEALTLTSLESPIGRITIITQTFFRIRPCFRMKVRFSDAFLVSHRINHRQRMQKIYMLLLLTSVWCGVQVLISASRV